MSWLWGSSGSSQSTPTTPTQARYEAHAAVPVSAPATPIHGRQLQSITAVDKTKLLNQIEEFASPVHEKDAIVCVNTPDLKIWRKQLPGEEMHLIKFLGTLRYPLDLIAFVLNTPHIRKQWDTVLENWDEHRVDDHLIVYLSVKLPFPLSYRDFVHLRCFHDEPCKSILVDISTHHPQFPEKPGYVRANTIFSGLRLTAVNENETEYMTVSQVDMAGYLPKAIVNLIAGSQPQQWFQNLEKACGIFREQFMAMKRQAAAAAPATQTQ